MFSVIAFMESVNAPTEGPSVGTAWGWGSNTWGELGIGALYSRSSPVQIGSLVTWTKIFSEDYSTFGIKSNGTLWAWGDDESGNLGLNDGSTQTLPIQVGNLTNWQTIAQSSSYTLAIKTDGTLWSWGSNLHGTLGVNDNINRSSPVQVGALTTWSKIASGLRYCFAIKTTGTLWAWGYNYLGYLGLGDRVERSVPTQIGTLTTWASVSSGNEHTVAIRANGTMWSWGANTGGCLGHNTPAAARESTPTQIGSLTTWKSVYAKNDFSLAIKTNGTLWGWGTNVNGELGLDLSGTHAHRSSPVQVGTDTDWEAVAEGDSGYTLALKTNGTIWSWGPNAGGQLGLGDKISRSVPVQVGTRTTWFAIASGMDSFALRG